MTPHENPRTSEFRFRELSTTECLMLLQSKRVGRIVWCGSSGPQALPVNYVVDDGRIAEHGTHEQLVAHSGIYAELFALQAAAYAG